MKLKDGLPFKKDLIQTPWFKAIPKMTWFRGRTKSRWTRKDIRAFAQLNLDPSQYRRKFIKNDANRDNCPGYLKKDLDKLRRQTFGIGYKNEEGIPSSRWSLPEVCYQLRRRGVLLPDLSGNQVRGKRLTSRGSGSAPVRPPGPPPVRPPVRAAAKARVAPPLRPPAPLHQLLPALGDLDELKGFDSADFPAGPPSGNLYGSAEIKGQSSSPLFPPDLLGPPKQRTPPQAKKAPVLNPLLSGERPLSGSLKQLMTKYNSPKARVSQQRKSISSPFARIKKKYELPPTRVSQQGPSLVRHRRQQKKKTRKNTKKIASQSHARKDKIDLADLREWQESHKRWQQARKKQSVLRR